MSVVRFLWMLFKPYQIPLIVGFLLALVAGLTTVSVLTLSGWFITASALAGAGQWVGEGVALGFNFLLPATEIRALAIIRTLAVYGERLYTHQTTFSVLADVRCWLFRALIPLAPGQLLQQHSADVLSVLTQDIDYLQGGYLKLIIPVLLALVVSLTVSYFVFSYSAGAGVSVLLMSGIGGFILPLIVVPFVRHQIGSIVALQTAFKTAQIALLQGMAELLVFNALARFNSHIVHISNQLLDRQYHGYRLVALASAGAGLLVQLMLMLVLFIVAIQLHPIQHDYFSPPQAIMLIFAVFALSEFLAVLPELIQPALNTYEAARRIQHISRLPNLIIEPQMPLSIPLTGEISIKDVSFRYQEQSEWILRSVNLQIPQGHKIAITGASGAGKTTLLQILLRFFDPQQGCIEFEGISYQQMHSDALRQRFAFMSQQSQLFSCSLRDNLRLAKQGASDQELVDVLMQVGLTCFYKKLANGLDSWIGENGATVSGGEARRIALARVCLKDAPVFLLDEPTEGLDKKTEDEILDGLSVISQYKTVILVTHRPAALRLVDKVYKMESGQLVVQG